VAEEKETIKKREKIPDNFLPPTASPLAREDVSIEVAGKTYPVPVLKMKAYKKLRKFMQESMSKPDFTEDDNLDFCMEYYYRILKPFHPELRKADFDDMPLYQAGSEFFLKVQLALYRTPLA